MTLLPPFKKEFYNENGFVQVDNVLTAEEVSELTQYLTEAMSSEEDHRATTISQKGSSYYRVLNQKVNVWRDHLGVARYSAHKKLAQLALELSGASGIRLFHDHGLWKMPNDSKETPWHQDFPYWPMNESGALSVWIPLDDVDEDNGCMMFVPGSHKVGKLNPIDLADPQDIYEYVKGTDVANARPVKVPLKAGSCTFHNGLTFHYAHANKTDKPRRVLAIIYMPDGTTFNGKAHLVTDGHSIEKDSPIIGGSFPLLAKI